MRPLLAFGVLLVTIAAYPQAKPSQTPRRTPAAAAQADAKRQFEADQKAIGELQQREITATKAFDVNELLSTWADDGVLLPPNHAPVVGREALLSFYQHYKNEFGNNDLLAYDENWEEVQVSGDWAYQWGTVTARMRPAAGKEETRFTLAAMRVLKRQPDGSWLVARAIFNHAASPATSKPAAPEAKPPSEPKPPQ